MCTAVHYQTKDAYFGRNLDLEYSYQEQVTVCPRAFPLKLRNGGCLKEHLAIIGMAFIQEGYPLYYDGVNEKGLAMAGLNFPGNAYYGVEVEGKTSVAPFALVPWVLGQCETVAEAKKILETANLVNWAFSKQLPLAPLHWMIADKERAITVEAVKEGLKIYENPVGVLTNNPPFPFMMQALVNYQNLSPEPSVNRFSKGLSLEPYCQGLAAVGLPGDYSSLSRFVKAAFVKENAHCGDSEAESVHQFFHILSSVEMPRGCVRLENGKDDLTIYSACCNQEKGIYYYVSYDNRQITAVDMHRENLDGEHLIAYPLRKSGEIHFEN